MKVKRRAKKLTGLRSEKSGYCTCRCRHSPNWEKVALTNHLPRPLTCYFAPNFQTPLFIFVRYSALQACTRTFIYGSQLIVRSDSRSPLFYSSFLNPSSLNSLGPGAFTPPPNVSLNLLAIDGRPAQKKRKVVWSSSGSKTLRYSRVLYQDGMTTR
jgi:hypothetical protein